LSDGDDAGGCGVSGDGRGSELIRGGRRNGHGLSGSRDGDGHGADITAGSITVARYISAMNVKSSKQIEKLIGKIVEALRVGHE